MDSSSELDSSFCGPKNNCCNESMAIKNFMYLFFIHVSYFHTHPPPPSPTTPHEFGLYLDAVRGLTRGPQGSTKTVQTYFFVVN